MTVLHFDMETQKYTERELSEEEIAEREENHAEWEAQKAAQEAKAKARASALAKLKKLGLTAAEIEAL
jgi:hypothetical protein